ncbi:MAG: response regulator transcription factor [Acidimicrobiia bacterium]|nr:response regulator transcription factor [Acidimicrobiia bacterium]
MIDTVRDHPPVPSPATDPVSILVVEDAPEFQQVLGAVLTREGHRVQTVASGEAALDAARSREPDVIVLDVGLPGIDGVETCRQLRRFTDAYVIMLTARDEEVDRLVGLAVGADDYMTKPFSARELVARIQVLMRRPRERQGGRSSTRVRIGDLEIDRDAHEVTVGGEDVSLTRLEFALLSTLAERPEMAFTRRMLLEQVWGFDWVGDDHVVDVHIANLRRKIDLGDSSHIRTVRGVGYRMETRPDS